MFRSGSDLDRLLCMSVSQFICPIKQFAGRLITYICIHLHAEKDCRHLGSCHMHHQPCHCQCQAGLCSEYPDNYLDSKCKIKTQEWLFCWNFHKGPPQSLGRENRERCEVKPVKPRKLRGKIAKHHLLCNKRCTECFKGIIPGFRGFTSQFSRSKDREGHFQNLHIPSNFELDRCMEGIHLHCQTCTCSSQ